MATKQNIVTGKHYTSKDEIIQDVLTILENCHAKKLSLRNAKKSIAWSIVDWTAFDGQFGNHMRHTANACPFTVIPNTKKIKVIHEHVVPKKLISEELFALAPPTFPAIQHIFNTYAIGAVISEFDDTALSNQGFRSSSPTGWQANPWLRYSKAGLLDCGCKIHPRW